jgi:hypothetical protein
MNQHFSDEEKETAIKTEMGNAAFAMRALVPRKVIEILSEMPLSLEAEILDFGCGKKMRHTKELRDMGHKVFGYDFAIEGSEKFLARQFDIVFASNVLNIQSTQTMLTKTILQLFDIVKRGGLLVFNFPPNPRKNDAKIEEIIGAFREFSVEEEDRKKHLYVLRRR